MTEEATGQSEQPSDLSVGNVILGNDIAVAVPISHPNPPHTHHQNSQTHKTGPELTKIKLRTALPASPHHKTFFCVTPLSLPTWELKLDVKTFVVLKNPLPADLKFEAPVFVSKFVCMNLRRFKRQGEVGGGFLRNSKSV